MTVPKIVTKVVETPLLSENIKEEARASLPAASQNEMPRGVWESKEECGFPGE